MPNKADAQQFVVDDAAITPFGSAQLESWVGELETWFMPAFGVLPGMEVSVAAYREMGTDRFDDWLYNLEIKYLLRDADEHDWGIGFAAGSSWDLFKIHGDDIYDGYYAFAIYTDHLIDDELTMHANLGFVSDYDDVSLYYGLGAEWMYNPRMGFIAEAYREGSESFHIQGGYRLVIVPDFLNLDFTYGFRTYRGDENFGFQFGLAWTP